MGYTYTLKHSILADDSSTITELDIERPVIGDVEAVKSFVVDGPEIWMARLLNRLTDLSLTETARIDLSDIRDLLNIVSKL